MGKHINWYLVELERAIADRIPGAELAETLNEIEAHLKDCTSEMAAICRHGQDPERMAVERFGSPSKMAEAITGEAGTPIIKEATKAPMVWSFCLGLCLTIIISPFLALFGSAVCLVGFCLAVSSAKRVYPRALAISVAANAVFATLYLGAFRSERYLGFTEGVANWFALILVLAGIYWGVLMLLNVLVRAWSAKGGLQWLSKAI